MTATSRVAIFTKHSQTLDLRDACCLDDNHDSDWARSAILEALPAEPAGGWGGLSKHQASGCRDGARTVAATQGRDRRARGWYRCLHAEHHRTRPVAALPRRGTRAGLLRSLAASLSATHVRQCSGRTTPAVAAGLPFAGTAGSVIGFAADSVADHEPDCRASARGVGAGRRVPHVQLLAVVPDAFGSAAASLAARDVC